MIILSDASSLTAIIKILSVKEAFVKFINQDAETSKYDKVIDFNMHKRKIIAVIMYKAHIET